MVTIFTGLVLVSIFGGAQSQALNYQARLLETTTATHSLNLHLFTNNGNI